MTNKTKTFSLLLAGTFLSSPAVAADTLNFGADNLNASPRLEWKEVSGLAENTIAVSLPDGTQYLQYEYKTSGASNPTDRQPYSATTVNGTDFLDIETDVPTGFGSYGGAALLSDNASVENAVFLGNAMNNRNGAYGGAVAVYTDKVTDTSSSIAGQFVNNAATYTGTNAGMASGGAIALMNSDGQVSGNFIGNRAIAVNGTAQGGAVSFVQGRVFDLGDVIDSNFINNFASGATARGGALYSSGQLHIYAENSDVYFLGNYVESNGVITANDIYQYNSYTALVPTGNHIIYLDGGIDGEDYYVEIGNRSYGTGTVYMANGINNAEHIYITPGTTLKFVKGARGQGEITGSTDLENYSGTFDLNNGYTENVRFKNYTSSEGTLHIDVDPVNNTSDKLEISGDVSGTTKLIVHALSTNTPTKSIVFAEAEGAGSADSFATAAVYGSPYDYEVQYAASDSGLKQWYFEGVEPENPDQPDVPAALRAEVIAGAGLHEAAIEQTRSLIRNVRTKVADGRVYCPGCGLSDYAWNNQQLRNVWVLAQGETATIDKPVKTDADIWGVEAGFDIQNDVNNTLGVFASYRKGEYDLSGKADKLRSNVGSEIDIDSYLAGLYYRYDKNMNWLFAAVYGGVQQADAKTDDKIAKFDTDGVEFGAAVEAGHSYELSDNLILEPSLGLYYTQINFDDAKDNVGKEYDWKDVKHLEAELGAKLEKQIDYAKIYVKPSVIRTITSGDSVRITGLNKLSTYDDATLGRIELGGRYGFTDALSAYGWVNYTFGSGYDATAFGAGLNYAW